MSAALSQQEKLPLSRGQRLLRIFGAALLTVCAAMVVLGLTLLSERLHGPPFVLYWTGCFLLTLLAIAVALWDMLLVRRASKQCRRELFRREFMSQRLAAKLQEKTNHRGEHT